VAEPESAAGLTSEEVLNLILPASVSHGYAGHLVDTAGRDYIDLVSAWGTNILGYGHPGVASAVAAQAAKYTNLGMAGPEFGQLYALLTTHIPCAEAIHLVKNGSDATAAAVRLARFSTGRTVVLHRGYHGAQDWYMAANRVPGVPVTHQDQIVTLATLDLASVQAAFDAHPGQIACLIIDPMLWPIPDASVMRGIAELVAAAGAVLVFDEVVSGFRVAVGGMQSVWGVTPDLACYGKGIANGMPLSALVGRERLMRHIPAINYSLTYGLEAVSIVAGIETIKAIVAQDVCGDLARKGQYLKRAYADLCAERGVRSALVGHDCRPQLHFDDAPGVTGDISHYVTIQELARRRISTYGTFTLCHAHTQKDLNTILAALALALDTVAWRLKENAGVIAAE
jgi:glutamate-1-semialdehyde aminotransferase